MWWQLVGRARGGMGKKYSKGRVSCTSPSAGVRMIVEAPVPLLITLLEGEGATECRMYRQVNSASMSGRGWECESLSLPYLEIPCYWIS